MTRLASNRKARFNYEILETFEAGIVLKGTEIKSLRSQGASLDQAYVRVIDSELWLLGASIAPYAFGNIANHEERRERKLLVHRREIQRLKESVKEKGLALVPLAIYLKAGKAKLEFGLARGKKLYDKRQSIKEREEKRETAQLTKKFSR
jgi:SsrA-binding protein